MSDKPKISAAPVIAALVLLLPMLYVVSYLLLVVPAGTSRSLGVAVLNGQILQQVANSEYYRWQPEKAAVVFWPLEKMDRKLPPAAWLDEVPVMIMLPEMEGQIGVDFGP